MSEEWSAEKEYLPSTKKKHIMIRCEVDTDTGGYFALRTGRAGFFLLMDRSDLRKVEGPSCEDTEVFDWVPKQPRMRIYPRRRMRI